MMTRLVSSAGLAVALFGVGCTTTDCRDFLGTHPCVGLEIRPTTGEYGSRFLVGDTIRVQTSSDSGFGSVAWSISGAAAILGPSGTVMSDPGPSSSVLVKGLTAGPTMITATHVSGRSANAALSVEDSSAVADLGLWSVAASVRVGDSVLVLTTLNPSAGVAIKGVPDSWTTSDAAIATVIVRVQPPCQPNTICLFQGPLAFVRGKAAGTAIITAGFRALRKSITVTVTP